ncbi:hypothetical protein JVU11DRAFT_4227 [Chiua virens]|nr:hypothetical protein JVU11DRAFT_4227 [Chiua virens]
MLLLELEIFHQIHDMIGIDPTFYEYIFTVDMDMVGSFYQHAGEEANITIDSHT